jgi:hypothetical protein
MMKFSELELDDGSQLCLKLSQLRLMDLQLEGRVAKNNPLIQKQRKRLAKSIGQSFQANPIVAVSGDLADSRTALIEVSRSVVSPYYQAEIRYEVLMRRVRTSTVFNFGKLKRIRLRILRELQIGFDRLDDEILSDLISRSFRRQCARDWLSNNKSSLILNSDNFSNVDVGQLYLLGKLPPALSEKVEQKVGRWVGRSAGFRGGAADNYGLAKIGGGPKSSGGRGIEGGKNRIDIAVGLSLIAVGAIGVVAFLSSRLKGLKDLIKFRAILHLLSNHPAEYSILVKQFEQRRNEFKFSLLQKRGGSVWVRRGSKQLDRNIRVLSLCIPND